MKEQAWAAQRIVRCCTNGARTILTDSPTAARTAGLPVVLCLIALLHDPAGHAQMPQGAAVVILADAEDSRLELVQNSVEFWNETLRDLGLKEVFVDVQRVTDFSRRAVETHTRQLSQQAGRPGSRHARPQPLAELSALEADVVLLLSKQDVMPFAWPFAASDEGSARAFYLIAVPIANQRSTTEVEDIVRHELGHTLGLEHTKGSAGLMCMPCAPATIDTADGADGSSRPLSKSDLKRLVLIYGSGSTNQERVQEPGFR